jgi:hypothetical protein
VREASIDAGRIVAAEQFDGAREGTAECPEDADDAIVDAWEYIDGRA